MCTFAQVGKVLKVDNSTRSPKKQFQPTIVMGPPVTSGWNNMSWARLSKMDRWLDRGRWRTKTRNSYREDGLLWSRWCIFGFCVQLAIRSQVLSTSKGNGKEGRGGVLQPDGPLANNTPTSAWRVQSKEITTFNFCHPNKNTFDINI